MHALTNCPFCILFCALAAEAGGHEPSAVATAATGALNIPSTSTTATGAASSTESSSGIIRPHLMSCPTDRTFVGGPANPSDITPGTRLIFLDVDGVLNRTSRSTHIHVEDQLMLNLSSLIERTSCRIVWSTFWRGFRKYLDYVLFRFEIGVN